VDTLLADAQKQSNKELKGKIGKHLQDLQKQNAELCPANLSASLSQEWRSVRAELYDGPQEVRQKLQLLRDISRDIQLRLTNLDQEMQTLKKERKTKERAEEFIEESTLFTDNVAVRRSESTELQMSTPDTTERTGGATTEILTRGELYGKEQIEQFELQYRQKRSDLLSQQKDIKHKLDELEKRARQLEIQ
jgi:hypothetical protein